MKVIIPECYCGSSKWIIKEVQTSPYYDLGFHIQCVECERIKMVNLGSYNSIKGATK